MDTKEYIASGIVERYAFGLVSPQEKQEVECMSHIYPEIADELKRYHESIEQLAIRGAVEPPAYLKELVMKRIRSERQATNSESKVIALQAKSSVIYKYAVAASVLLIIGLGLGWMNDRSNMVAVKNELIAQVKQNDSLTNSMNGELKALSETNQFLSDSNTLKVTMTGTPTHPGMKAIVYWNSKNQKVMLASNSLETPPSDKQYQLWAIVDGQPKDMGVFDLNNSNTLVEMKSTASAQAFAITLEPKGGSISPSLDQMYVLGTI